jgi:AcrR family transcriptional regulator
MPVLNGENIPDRRLQNGRSAVTATRREREKAQRREDILQAAREVFFERGIHHATVDEVAEQAQVSKGTVYLYFDTKETILAHLLLEGLEELVAMLEDAYAAGRDIAPVERLRRLAMGYFSFFQANPHYYRLIMAFDRGHFQESVPPALYAQVLTRSMRGFHRAVQTVQQPIPNQNQRHLTAHPKRRHRAAEHPPEPNRAHPTTLAVQQNDTQELQKIHTQHPESLPHRSYALMIDCTKQ